MLVYLLVALITLVAGTLQAITGFGGGILIMVFLPSLLPMNLAPAVSGTVCAPLSWSIAVRYRKSINAGKMVWPIIFYLIGTTIAIKVSTQINMDMLKPVFGVFLIILAIYFMFFSNRVNVRGNMLTAFFCSFVSGVLGGFFGIGGPLLVLYFLAVTSSKEEYLGTINGVFSFTTFYQLFARIAAGILTWSSFPLILIGTASILLGRVIGSKIVERLDAEKMKKAIYVFLTFAGAVTLVNSL